MCVCWDKVAGYSDDVGILIVCSHSADDSHGVLTLICILWVRFRCWS